jgi:hypothetical protein
MMRLLLSTILLLLSAGSLSERRCSCQKALEHDLPHGANETVEYVGKTVKRIAGRVISGPNDDPAEDVVVEIYEISQADKNLRPHEIVLRSQRKVACVTPKDGSFCFPDLPSGRYMVRAGTRSANAGMNEVFIRVNVDRRWWSRWFRPDKKIELALTPGT